MQAHLLREKLSYMPGYRDEADSREHPSPGDGKQELK
jgi:hypothetical protein